MAWWRKAVGSRCALYFTERTRSLRLHAQFLVDVLNQYRPIRERGLISMYHHSRYERNSLSALTWSPGALRTRPRATQAMKIFGHRFWT